MHLTQQLAKFHPLIIEGMGYYDPRNPQVVAAQIVKQVESHFENRGLSAMDNNKPKLLITQGDPPAERGISAITPLVSEMLDIPRGLVVLDEHIDPNHTLNAPRENVIWEAKYSDLLVSLSEETIRALEQKVAEEIEEKNQRRKKIGKSDLASYFKDYAMLQEVTKASLSNICGDVTVAHTQKRISEFSVTSFYSVGLDLKLLDSELDYVSYGIDDDLDFEAIDKR